MTVRLIFGSLLVTLVIGTIAGTISAVKGGVVDRVVGGLSLAGFSLPSFWVGAVLISFFAVRLGWLPAIGYVDFAQSPSGWFESLVLPVAALSLGGVAMIAKQTREAMLDVLGSEYIRMARASGLSRAAIYYKCALKNAGIRVVTVSGILAVGLLGGTVVVEAVFALPGLGRLAVEAATRHDLPVIQGVVVYFTVFVVLINLTVDLLYLWLDPRVRRR